MKKNLVTLFALAFILATATPAFAYNIYTYNVYSNGKVVAQGILHFKKERKRHRGDAVTVYRNGQPLQWTWRDVVNEGIVLETYIEGKNVVQIKPGGKIVINPLHGPHDHDCRP